MKRPAFLLALLVALQVSLLSLAAVEPPKECCLCAGAVSDLQPVPTVPVPLLVRIRQDDFATVGTTLDPMPSAVRPTMPAVVGYTVDPGKDPMADVETHTQSIIAWARLHGPFEALGIAVDNVDSAVAGYAIKRLAVAAQGQNAASRIVLPPSTPEALTKLYETGAQSYVDVLLTAAADVKSTAAWVAEKDPAKK